MKFENTQVCGFERALMGMRNPMESWDKSDSHYESIEEYLTHEADDPVRRYMIGHNDMDLAQRLIKAGAEHRKFLRQIFVSVDITAPSYFMAEFDTYKIGTGRNSTSFMHKGVSKPFELTDFEIDEDDCYTSYLGWEHTLNTLNNLRDLYLDGKNYKYFRLIRQLLPQSYLYTSTITMNYEVIRNMVHQRKNHKLNEWSGIDDPTKPNFISWARTLPYAEEFIFLGS